MCETAGDNVHLCVRDSRYQARAPQQSPCRACETLADLIVRKLIVSLLYDNTRFSPTLPTHSGVSFNSNNKDRFQQPFTPLLNFYIGVFTSTVIK